MTNKDVPMLELRNVKKMFGDFTAVYPLTLNIPKGTIYALLGPNGAGKTTTLRMILGILRPTEGEVLVDGISVHKHPEKAKSKIGYMPQAPALYNDLTVWENLEFYADMYGCRSEERLNEILEFVELSDFKNRLLGHLSGGMKQRASLGCAMVHDPPLLILDEPTAGVDPVVRRRMWDYFNTLKKKGHTILVTTHYMDEVVYADTVHLLRRGKTMMKGTVDEIIDNMGVEPTYKVWASLPSQAVNNIKLEKGSVKQLDDGKYLFQVHSKDAFSHLTTAIYKRGGLVENVKTEFPTLEDAFVYYSEKHGEV